MRGWTLGVLCGALWLVGCGKTDDSPGGNAAGSSAQGGQGAAGTTASAGNPPTAGGGAESNDFPAAKALHKLDLLLMVDNSRHMAVKQQLLSDAVNWLLTPGMGPQLAADDVHIGVISSSLGSHGASNARDVCVQAGDDDHARLLATVRPNVKSFQSSGFLAWGPGAEPNITNVLVDVEQMVLSAGQQGCGYEASLEAWYRFLVDPTPPLQVVLDGTESKPLGVDELLLAQRRAFLRPDSVVSIVVLSDENDCSIIDRGYGWLVAHAEPLYGSTSACKNPNDPCCQSCSAPTAAAGCPSPASDPSCSQNMALAAADDDLNLRCYQQKRRFGFDFLQPISRYRDALKRKTLTDAAGRSVDNPLFAGGMRHPSQVIFTGIVGVPWQDVADQASLTGSGLTYLTADELARSGHWSAILGDPGASPPVLPTDPFMLETPADRSTLGGNQQNPFVAESIVAAGSTNPRANAINGHESVFRQNDLQSACIFPLAQPILCDAAANDAGASCYCFDLDLPEYRAVCQPPQGGQPGITQYFAQAYPGLRHLQLMKELGSTAVAASICPKVLEPAHPDYGYRPAMKAMAALVQHGLAP